MAKVTTMEEFEARMADWKKIESEVQQKFGNLQGNKMHADQKLKFYSRLRSESKGLGGFEGKVNRDALKGEIHKLEKAKYKWKVGVYFGRLQRSAGRKISNGYAKVKQKAIEKYQNWRNPPSDGDNQKQIRGLNNSQKENVALRHGMAPSMSTVQRVTNRQDLNNNRQQLGGDPSSNRLKNNLREGQMPKMRIKPKF